MNWNEDLAIKTVSGAGVVVNKEKKQIKNGAVPGLKANGAHSFLINHCGYTLVDEVAAETKKRPSKPKKVEEKAEVKKVEAKKVVKEKKKAPIVEDSPFTAFFRQSK